MDPSSGIPVRSGIPRPTSRLPVLKPSGSQSQLRPPASTSAAEPLRKKPSLSSISRTSQPPSSLQKKPSLSSISRTSQPSTLLQKKTSRASLARTSTPLTASTANTNSNRAPLSATSSTKRAVPANGQARTSTSTSKAPTFKKPIGRPSSRQTRTVSQPTRASNINKEEDVLGDLDGFRSASRASSRADSQAGFREAEPEHIYIPENDLEVEDTKPKMRKVRPSLSERTIESLSQVPPSPAGAKGRRRSSFFNAENSMPPPLRPASAMSNGGRPTTSDGATLTTPRRLAPQSSRESMTVPSKRSISATVAPSVPGTPSRTPISRLSSITKKQPLPQTHNVQAAPQVRPLSNSKSMAARTPKSRSSLAGAFGQAISPPGTTVAATPSLNRKESVIRAKPVTSQKSTALRAPIAKTKIAPKPAVTSKQPETPPRSNASQTLREQIAKAREAARRANTTSEPSTKTPPRESIIPDPVEIAEFDFGLGDPFNQASKGSKSLLRKRIDGGRVDGRLNLAAMGLKEVPADVLQMYKYDPNDTSVAWGDVVDLTVIVAADNEFEALPEAMFPDIDMASAIDSDDDNGPQFGAIQNFDLHGNVLRELPMGLRRLTQLTKLNLSRNKLTLGALEVICQITPLRDLKLAENALEGAFPSSLQNLTQLEILELQNNKLTHLPAEIRALVHLRTLNVADNCFTALPIGLFTSVPLVELIAAKNAFSGAFFDVDMVPHLQNLHLSNNSLTSLCGSSNIDLPALKYLDLGGNRLSALPDISSWTSLTTLLMRDNNLSSLPDGFLTLKMLRNADFTANNLNKLDGGIALMEGLENLTLAANPIRERKFLTMSTADVKRDLLSRVQHESIKESQDTFAEDSTTTNNKWKLTPSGTLDLSSQNLTQLDEDDILSFPASNEIRQLYLASNCLTMIPTITVQLSFLTALDLSKNNIGIPLSHPLEFTKLRELHLNGNKIQSLHEITSLLSTPKLTHLDVSTNRISGSLPNLRDFFPELLRFVAADNSISEVPAESLQGLKMVNLSNNEIGRLEPSIGRYAGTLTSLEVEGNRFRVPNYAVLKKGTEAILSWLSDKIPSATEQFSDPDVSRSPSF